MLGCEWEGPAGGGAAARLSGTRGSGWVAAAEVEAACGLSVAATGDDDDVDDAGGVTDRALCASPMEATVRKTCVRGSSG